MAYDYEKEMLAGDESDYRSAIGHKFRYDLSGADQFALITHLGLRDFHSVLELGCGSLCAGRMLIAYLRPGMYCGIEPLLSNLEGGIDHEMGREILALKQVKFDYNKDFNLSAFGRKFDYILSHSILSHAAKWQIEKCFASAKENLNPNGMFLFTYRRTRKNDIEHMGPEWIYPALSNHSQAYMEKTAADAGLKLFHLKWMHLTQRWCAVMHADAPVPERLKNLVETEPSISMWKPERLPRA